MQPGERPCHAGCLLDIFQFGLEFSLRSMPRQHNRVKIIHKIILEFKLFTARGVCVDGHNGVRDSGHSGRRQDANPTRAFASERGQI